MKKNQERESKDAGAFYIREYNKLTWRAALRLERDIRLACSIVLCLCGINCVSRRAECTREKQNNFVKL